MREYLEKYITIIYYACKTYIHGKFACTCDLLNKTRNEYWRNSDNGVKCTCLTKNSLDALIDMVFEKILPIIGMRNQNKADSTCGAVFEYSNIRTAENNYNALIRVLSKKEDSDLYVQYFNSIKFKLDIICCYMALTHNRSVENSGLRIVIRLLFELTDKETENVEITELKNAIKVLFGPAKSTVFEKHIELCSVSDPFVEKYEKIFLDIYKSYNIVRRLDLQRELDGYFLYFDKMLFTPPQPLENLDKSLPSETDCEKKALDRLSNSKKAKK